MGALAVLKATAQSGENLPVPIPHKYEHYLVVDT